MTNCPYCRQPMAEEHLELPLPRRQLRIYIAVSSAGVNGISKDALLDAMYKDEKRTPGEYIVLRVQIHGLNRAIGSLDQRIMARGGSYYLIKKT